MLVFLLKILGRHCLPCLPPLKKAATLFFLLLFSKLFFVLYERVNGPGWGRKFLSLGPFLFLSYFRFSFFLVSFPGVDARRGSMYILVVM